MYRRLPSVPLTGEPPRASRAGGGPVRLLRSAVGGAVSSLRFRLRSVRKVVWRAEDLAVGGARLAWGVARRSARPLLVALVVGRALQTVGRGRLPEMRMARMTPAEQVSPFHQSRLILQRGFSIVRMRCF